MSWKDNWALSELERVIEKTEQVPRHVEIFGGMTMGMLRDLFDALKAQNVAWRVLRCSWAPIDFTYERLTSKERALLSKEEFVSLLNKAVPNGTTAYARGRIVEGGHGFEGDPSVPFIDYDGRLNPHYVHAEAGEEGYVEHITDDGVPQVRFRRTGTATLVSWPDISVE